MYTPVGVTRKEGSFRVATSRRSFSNCWISRGLSTDDLDYSRGEADGERRRRRRRRRRFPRGWGTAARLPSGSGVPGLGSAWSAAPVRQHLGAVAVDFEPGQRVAEDVAMEQSALRLEGGPQIHQPRLHREDLVQPLDVAARHRQDAEIDPALERIRREAPAAHQPERREQRAHEDRIGQRVGRRGESLRDSDRGARSTPRAPVRRRRAPA